MAITQTKVVDDFDFNCTPHDVIAATKLFARIARIVGPALARGDVTSDTDMTFALSSLLGGLEDQAIEALIGDTLKLSTCIRRTDADKPTLHELSSPARINAAFADRGVMLFKAMGFALEVNFKNFFGGSGQLEKWLATLPVKP